MEAIELTMGTYYYRYFFDTDTQQDGIDVFDYNKRHLGSMHIEIPDMGSEPEEVSEFEARLEEWVHENSF